MKKPTLNLLQLENAPVFQQLQLEEALLRTDTNNWCLINSGSPPTVVLGISSKQNEWINQEKYARQPIPVVRRFTGGGTVVIEEDTLLVTFICSAKLVDIPPLPQKVLAWSEEIYTPVFSSKKFSVQQTDYVWETKKIGGNAQYMAKDRWVHHTSFLWKYTPSFMEYLSHPPKMPSYRKGRTHRDFLFSIDSLFPSKQVFVEQLIENLSSSFTLCQVPPTLPLPLENKPHRKTTKIL